MADLVWSALGNAQLFIEPFFGSGAVFWKRPHPPRREIINDADGFVANFWRAVQRDAASVARHADRPVTEIDLLAHHRALCDAARKRRFLGRLAEDAKYFDARIAGLWCWGTSLWIGSGFCGGDWYGPGDCRNRGTGIVNTHKPRLKPDGVVGVKRRDRLQEILAALSNRMRKAVVLCGDWSRCFMPSDLAGRKGGPQSTGIFLDPPYAHRTVAGNRDPSIYRVEMPDTSAVEKFCREHGRKRHVRIVLAGLSGEYDLPGWRIAAWRRPRSHQTTAQAVANLGRERLWISPHCLPFKMDRSARGWAKTRIWGTRPTKRTPRGNAKRERV